MCSYVGYHSPSTIDDTCASAKNTMTMSCLPQHRQRRHRSPKKKKLLAHQIPLTRFRPPRGNSGGVSSIAEWGPGTYLPVATARNRRAVAARCGMAGRRGRGFWELLGTATEGERTPRRAVICVLSREVFSADSADCARRLSPDPDADAEGDCGLCRGSDDPTF